MSKKELIPINSQPTKRVSKLPEKIIRAKPTKKNKIVE
jgi:hypothetical protein